MAAFIEGVVLWRKLHVFVARSFLGNMPGTGYTSGVDYLIERANGDARARNSVVAEADPDSKESEHAESLALTIRDLECDMRGLISELHQFDAVERSLE